MNVLLIILLPALCLTFIGCLPIPHSHTLMPGVTFIVADAGGIPVDSTTITIYSGDVIGETISDRMILCSDKTGIARCEEISKTFWFYGLIPDMEAPLEWVWCVQKPGFACITGRLGWKRPDSVRVMLVVDSSGYPCPQQPKYLYDIHRGEYLH